MSYQTIRVRFEESCCFLQLHRPEADNAVNGRLIEEFHQALTACDESISVLVLEGLPEVFCVGADFQGIHEKKTSGFPGEHDPELLYDLWLKLATAPYITISHVRGRANAGGVGFIAASDIVVADRTAQFSLSELLFGLFPACVLPFLIRRIGFQRAHYLTLMTKPILVEQAHAWGLVDAYDAESESLLRRHLLRLKRLPGTGIARYKRYMSGLQDIIVRSKPMAVGANREIFSDPRNLSWISQYVEKGQFPWEN